MDSFVMYEQIAIDWSCGGVACGRSAMVRWCIELPSLWNVLSMVACRYVEPSP